MYKTPKFDGPQLLCEMVKVHFYFFTEKVLLLESHHKIMEVFPWIFRIYRSIFNGKLSCELTDPDLSLPSPGPRVWICSYFIHITTAEEHNRMTIVDGLTKIEYFIRTYAQYTSQLK